MFDAHIYAPSLEQSSPEGKRGSQRRPGVLVELRSNVYPSTTYGEESGPSYFMPSILSFAFLSERQYTGLQQLEFGDFDDRSGGSLEFGLENGNGSEGDISCRRPPAFRSPSLESCSRTACIGWRISKDQYRPVQFLVNSMVDTHVPSILTGIPAHAFTLEQCSDNFALFNLPAR